MCGHMFLIQEQLLEIKDVLKYVEYSVGNNSALSITAINYNYHASPLPSHKLIEGLLAWFTQRAASIV